MTSDHCCPSDAASCRGRRFVFKGGTALRFCYVDGFRYSADLDDSTPPRIRFIGPLGRERRIKLDLAEDELVVEAERVLLRTHWEDVRRDVLLQAYTTLEIAGEKLRCIVQRLQCRDLFDLDVLFEELDVDPGEAADRFRRKADHRGIDPNLFSERYRQRLGEYSSRWERELGDHIAATPHFEEIERRVSRQLRRTDLL